MKHFEEGGRNDQETWPILQDKMVETMSKFVNVFSPRLEEMSELKNES